MALDERTRLAYLEAMGIQAWSLRAGSTLEPMVAEVGAEKKKTALPGEEPGSDEPPEILGAFHHELDVHAKPNALRDNETPKVTSPGDWEYLQAEVTACTACPLHQTRTQTVFGVGDHQADWMVIGEAPGEQEDLRGEPFVGPAGMLLNEMLRAIGLKREEVFIANVLKCRPPRNRDPEPEEAACCESFLRRQLDLVQPRIILAVGRIAAQNLLKTTVSIGKLRGTVHNYCGVPLVVTYHPAYLLRSPLEKRKAWDDLLLAVKTCREQTAETP